jgi:hypothetical protein
MAFCIHAILRQVMGIQKKGDYYLKMGLSASQMNLFSYLGMSYTQ